MAEPGNLRLMRDASTRWVEAGGYVTLSYTLRNAGTESVEEIALSDSLAGEIARIDRIGPGESVTVSLRLRVDEDLLSESWALYTVRGEDGRAEAEDLRIRVDSPALRVAISDDDGVLTASVTNDGPAPLYDVRLSERVSGDLGEAAPVLDPGETVRVTLDGTPGERQAAAQADTAAGRRLTAVSGTLTVPDEPAGTDEGVTMTARLTADGAMLTIDNRTGAPLSGLTLTEARTGTARAVARAPRGEMDLFWPAYDTSAETAEFSLSGPEGALAEESLELGGRTWPARSGGPRTLLEGETRPQDRPDDTYRAVLGATLTALALCGAIWLGLWRRDLDQRRGGPAGKRQA